MTWLSRAKTADEVLQGIRLDGLRIIVTGSSAGIGFEAAKALARAAAQVVLPCRTVARARETAERIRVEIPEARLEPAVLDLGDLASVAEFVAQQRERPVDILICNAGVYPAAYAESADGIERCFATCHVGHHALVRGLERQLTAAQGRVVVVASESHRSPKRLDFDNLPPGRDGFSPLRAYGQAKLANVLFAAEARRRLGDRGVRVFALHPGTMIRTSIGRDSMVAKVAMALASPFTKTVAEGAATTVHCAASPETAEATALYFRDCRPLDASDEANDPAVAKRLWQLTEDLLKARAFPLPGED